MKPVFVQVAVNVPQISGLFDYDLPVELVGKVKPGCLVVVPFGKQMVQGIVVRMVDAPQVSITRPVETLLDTEPVITAHQLRLAAWMAEETLAPLSACLDLMLPPGLSQMADTLYTLRREALPPLETLQPTLQVLVDLLERRGSLRGRQIDAALPHRKWENSARTLVKSGALVTQAVLPPPAVRPKVVRTVQIAASLADVEAKRSKIGREGTDAFQRRERILEFLVNEGLPVEAPWVYAASGGSLADLEKLADLELVRLSEAEVWRDPLEKIVVSAREAPDLTPDQTAVWADVQNMLASKAQNPLLLRGVTGSGKTEIYLRAVAETLRAGRQAIILVPEISLTPQTVRRFMARFPGQVGLIHSRLSPGERYDTWRRIRAGKLPVVVGPRSALFSPLPDPGLIVVDECHEDTYYQDDIIPAYSAVRTAAALGRMNQALVIFGSATPPVSLRYQAERQHWQVLELPRRILTSSDGEDVRSVTEMPPVEVVDMRQELKDGNRSMFSRTLLKGIETVLAANQQVILYLNRRGSATYVFCRACGTSLRCPRCETPLTFHSSQEKLVCHTCGYRRLMPKKCAQCGSDAIRQLGVGTERVEAEIKKEFPQAQVLRLDSETSAQKDAQELLLAHFVNHRADILVGTQMLAKGLDIPLVTLVGVVLADVGLNLPDFRASERTFQLLTQVAGRAGRGQIGGRVIFQTFMPQHAAIQFASRHDDGGFYAADLEERRRIVYPPFARLVRLEFRGEQESQVEAQAVETAGRIRHWIEQGDYRSTNLIGPAPCFFGRQNQQYRWQIILRGPDPVAIIRDKPLGNVRISVDPVSLL